MSKRNLAKATRRLEETKKEDYLLIPGFLGFTLKGKNVVEVPTRRGYVYVRVRGQTSEVVQASNSVVAPVYGLPVLITRDEIDRSRYRIVGRDTGVYSSGWGTSSVYLARHGNTHSFSPETRGGGDMVWVYSQQMMPLAVIPSGTSGAAMLVISPFPYYLNDHWIYAGGTCTASLLTFKPTGSSARMVLVYLDPSGNPQLTGSSTYFDASITGIAAVLPYTPGYTGDNIPLAGVRLVSGTSEIVWGNLYDLRPWFTPR